MTLYSKLCRDPQGQLLLEDVKDRPLDGYGTTGQPEGRLLEWPYTHKNALYYGRDAVALSDAERSQQVQVCSPDWNSPYSRNLHSSQVCSPRSGSIAKAGRKHLTRHPAHLLTAV